MEYDLHIHTHYSKCSNLRPETILKLAKKLNLNGIAIADHNEIKGALEVKKLNRDKDFEVVIAEEVSTNYGDVLVYYLSKKIRETNFFDVADEAKKQGALISIAHPFRTTLIHNHKFKLSLEKIKNKIDAIECFNSRTLPGDNNKASKTADRLGLAKTAGSDSHFFFEIGAARTVFEGNLRKALKSRQTNVRGAITLGPLGGALSYLRNRIF